MTFRPRVLPAEFMFLMLGETLLQVIIVKDWSGSGGLQEDVLNYTTLSATAALVLAAAVMFLFHQMVLKEVRTDDAVKQGVRSIVGKRDQARQRVVDRIKRASRDLDGEHDLAETSVIARLSKQRPSLDENSVAVVAGRASAAENATKPHAKFALSAVFNSAHEISSITSTKQRKEDEMRAQQLLLKARFINAVTFVFWQAIAISVLLVGVGVKLAIYDPRAPADAFYSFEQRVGLGVPVAFTSLIPLANSVLLRDRHHYHGVHRRHFELLRRQPVHFVLLTLRLVIFRLAIGICWLKLIPGAFLGVQTGLALLQCALLHYSEHRAQITTSTASLDSQLSAAVNTLSLKAKHARDKLALSSVAKENRTSGHGNVGGAQSTGESGTATRLSSSNAPNKRASGRSDKSTIPRPVKQSDTRLSA